MPSPKIPVADWEQRRESFNKHMDDKFKKYERYRKWYRGDFSDVQLTVMKADGTTETKGRTSPVNMTAMVGRSFISHLYFNAPQVIVKATVGQDEKMRDLADVETANANNMVDECNLYEEGARALLHGFLGPNMIMKIGYSAEMEEDIERIEKERELARGENDAFMSGDKPEATIDEYHAGHIDIHYAQMELINRGDLKDVHQSIKDAILAHIEAHEEFQKKVGEQYFETVRAERVFVRHKRPNLIFFDQFATDYQSLRFIGEVSLCPVEEIKEQRKVKNYTISSATLPDGASIDHSENDHYFGEKFVEFEDDGVPKVLLVEVVDLKNNEVVTYVLGAEKALNVKPYHMKDIMPAGPYIITHFDEDPDMLSGQPQPSFWETQQYDVALLNTVEVITASMSVPGMIFDSRVIDDETLQATMANIIGRNVAADMSKVDARISLKQLFEAMPAPQLSQETVGVKRTAMDLIERQSLMGQTRLGGGDKTRTATASALMNEAVGAMTQRAAIRVDKFFKTVARCMVRIARKYYSVQTVAKAAGDKAYDIWPEKFQPSEILDDRGVDIVVGTMRRESTDVELKLLGDLFATVIRHPAFAQSPVLQIVSTRLMDHMFKLYGAPIDLSDIEKSVTQNPQNFTAPPGAGGGGAAPQGGSGEMADVMSGMQNMMGGGGGAASAG